MQFAVNDDVGGDFTKPLQGVCYTIYSRPCRTPLRRIRQERHTRFVTDDAPAVARSRHGNLGQLFGTRVGYDTGVGEGKYSLAAVKPHVEGTAHAANALRRSNGSERRSDHLGSWVHRSPHSRGGTPQPHESGGKEHWMPGELPYPFRLEVGLSRL